MPRSITLEIGFYQRTSSEKEILKAQLVFQDFEDGVTNQTSSYAFQFHFYPLNWLDCFDFDGFRDTEYYASVLVLCLLLLAIPLLAFIIFLLIGRNRRPSGAFVFLRQYLAALLVSITQSISALLTLYIGGFSVLWAITVPAKTWNSQVGDYNDITPIKSDSDARVVRYQSGRMGVGLLVAGLMLIKWSVSLLIPLKESTGFSYETDLKRQQEGRELPRKQGPVLASAIVSLFIALIYDSFGSFPIFTEYGEVWIIVFTCVSYAVSLVLYTFLQDDLYILPSKLALRLSLYLMLLNSQRLSLVMVGTSIIMLIRTINQVFLVRFHKYYILDILIKRYERTLPFQHVDDEAAKVTNTLREAADNCLYVVVGWLSAGYALFAYVLYDFMAYGLYRSHMLYCFYFLAVVAVFEGLVNWLLSWARQMIDSKVALSAVIESVYYHYLRRSTRWALCSSAPHSPSMRTLNRGQELALSGLSSQFFLAITLFGLGVLNCAMGVKMFRSWPVNPFLDYWMFVVGVLSGGVCWGLKTAAVLVAKRVLWRIPGLNVYYERGVDGSVITNPTEHIHNEVLKMTESAVPSSRRDFQVSTSADDIVSIASGKDSIDHKIRRLVELFEDMDLLSLINTEQCFLDLAKELDISNPEQVKERLKDLNVPEHKVQLLSAHRAKLDIPYPLFPQELLYAWGERSEVFPAVSMYEEEDISEGKVSVSSRENSTFL